MIPTFHVYVNGKSHGRVNAVKPTGVNGIYFDDNQYQPETLAPYMLQVRERIPYKWRKSFDRERSIWYDKHHNTLRLGHPPIPREYWPKMELWAANGRQRLAVITFEPEFI